MIKFLATACAALLFWTSSAVAETHKPVARIGVLAYRGSENLETLCPGLQPYLEAAIPEWNFEIVPVTLNSASEEIASGGLDFILTNPAHYAALHQSHRMSVIASRLRQIPDGTYLDAFGGAVIARKDSGISGLQHAKGKSVVAVSPHAFGGFQMAWREFDELGVDLFRDTESLTFVGFPMDQVMTMVLNGQADIGIVRGGLAEAMAQEGTLDMGDLVFLNPNATFAHPYKISTRLYPEWPFVTFATTPAELRDKVALALLSANDSPLARQSEMRDRWSAPVSYHTVQVLSAAYQNRIRAAETRQRNIAMAWVGLAAVMSLGLMAVAWRFFTNTGAAVSPDSSRAEAAQTLMTPREGEILKLIAGGSSTKEIAERLKISPKTVEFHRSNLLRKFGARTSSQLIALAT